MKVDFSIDYKHCVTKFMINNSSAHCKINGPAECFTKNENTKGPYFEVKFYSEHLKSTETVAHYVEIIETILNLVVLPLDTNKMIQVFVYIINFDEHGIVAALNSILLNLIVAGIPLNKFCYAVGHKHDFLICDMDDICVFEQILEKKPAQSKELKEAMKYACKEVVAFD